jgi:beta-glucosidase
VPVYITENGLPDAADTMRPAFLAEHVRRVWLAANFNWNIAGYYHWSLVDNFEWGEGWRMKFGLYALDPITQARALRQSGRLYGEICKANALSAEMVQEFAPELMEKMFPN